MALEGIGLTENEGKIYVSLVERGASTVSDIAKSASIHRPTIYKTLPRMEELGLVSTSKVGERTLYVAESPERLSGYYKSNWERLQEALKGLQETYDAHGSRPILKYYEGKSSITRVLADVIESLKRGDVFYRYSSVEDVKLVDEYRPKDYRKIRDAKGLERFVIATEEYAKQKKKRMERQIRTLPKSSHLFDHNVSMLIYGKKIAYIDYNTESAFILENEHVAAFQKDLFKILYAKL